MSERSSAESLLSGFVEPADMGLSNVEREFYEETFVAGMTPLMKRKVFEGHLVVTECGLIVDLFF